jgi:hypothetical protein
MLIIEITFLHATCNASSISMQMRSANLDFERQSATLPMEAQNSSLIVA